MLLYNFLHYISAVALAIVDICQARIDKIFKHQLEVDRSELFLPDVPFLTPFNPILISFQFREVSPLSWIMYLNVLKSRDDHK